MKISDLDKSDKPREKAMRHGIGTLTNAELLAIVIGSGLPGQSVVELSQSMLLGSDNKLSALSRQSIGEMSRKHKGIGPAKAVSIAAAFELGRRCMAETPVEVLQIRTAADIDRYIRSNTRLALIDYEEFWVLKITRSNRIKGASRVSSGGTAATVVDVKMVMKEAVDSLCDGMVLVHNHPSGNLNASPEDIKLTKRIKEACDLFGIRLIDHVIIGGNSYMSFRDRDIL
ncbi:MAG: DNA repair protein RadC [Paramuribaculum sp.]|nr:DNA repair protein RadC [Paramuribaculum sp.]